MLDMLRFQKWTVGKAWVPEYGSADASAEQFAWLYAYSPDDNVKDGTAYPPTLVMTSDHDDRVYPAHSFKFAAALQHAQSRRRAGPAAGRVQGRPRRRPADRQDHRRRSRPLRVPGQEPELHAGAVTPRAPAAPRWLGRAGVGAFALALLYPLAGVLAPVGRWQLERPGRRTGAGPRSASRSG